MIDPYLPALTLLPVLVYGMSRKPHNGSEILHDYIVPPGVDVESCTTHWGAPAGVSRFNRDLLSEIKCHPDYIERNVPDCWFQWNPKDARKRARVQARTTANGVLPIRKHAIAFSAAG
jgi:hypothetical protein